MQNSGMPVTLSTSAVDSSPPSRSAHTLPPITSVSTQQGGDELENTSVISRRPTFPFSRQQLHKSETSAFTPVGQNALSEDDLASTATLTASVMSIPGCSSAIVGGGGGSLAHPSTNFQTTPTFTSTTPTDGSMTTFQSGSKSAQESTLTRTSALGPNSNTLTPASSTLGHIRSPTHVIQTLPSGADDRKGVINGIEDEDDRIMIGSMPGDEEYDISFPSGIAGTISWLQSQVSILKECIAHIQQYSLMVSCDSHVTTW